MGGAWRFGRAHLLNVPQAVERLRSGYRLPERDPNLQPSAFSLPYGELWTDLSRYCVRACGVEPVEDGFTFRLGGRALTVVASPGHSVDGMVLADMDNGLLFTGDTVYPGPLYAHLAGADGAEQYAATLDMLARRFSGFTLFCAHNAPVWEGGALLEILPAFHQALSDPTAGEDYMGFHLHRYPQFGIVV